MNNRNMIVGNLPQASPAPTLNIYQPVNLQQFQRCKVNESRLRKRNMLTVSPSQPIVHFVKADPSNFQTPQSPNNNYNFMRSRQTTPQ